MAKILDKMKKILQQGLEVVKKGTEIVAEKTPEVAVAVAERTSEALSIGKLKLQIQTINHKIDKNYAEIGKRAYELIQKKAFQIETDESLKKVVDSVNKLKKDIRTVEKKIEALKKEEQKRKKTPLSKPRAKTPATQPKAKATVPSRSGVKATKAPQKEEKKEGAAAPSQDSISESK